MRFLARGLMGVFLLGLTLGLLAFAGLTVQDRLEERWSREAQSRPARERVFVVNVVTVTAGTEQPVITTFGEVRSRRTLDLRAPAGGMIVDLNEAFVEGGVIEAGTVLLKVDPADAQAALDVAETDLAEAIAEVTEAKREIVLAEDDLAGARAQRDLRARALARQTDLKARGVGTDAAVETAELALSAADQTVLSKRRALAQAEARLTQTRTILKRRTISRDEAARRLADTTLEAEFSGTLTEVTAVRGGLVNANERIGRLVDPDALEVEFRVSNAQYRRLLDDQGKLTTAEVTLRLDVFGVDLSVKGRIRRESAAVGDGQTGRLLFAQLEGAAGLRPGDFVSVDIQEPPLRQVARVPSSAVDADGTVLVLGEEDRLETREVEVLRRQGDAVLIRAREVFGSEIVAARSPLLGDGIRVRPIRPDTAKTPEAPQTVKITDEQRSKLIAFVEANQRMPEDVKKRILAQLAKEEVPAQMVERLTRRMGG